AMQTANIVTAGGAAYVSNGICSDLGDAARAFHSGELEAAVRPPGARLRDRRGARALRRRVRRRCGDPARRLPEALGRAPLPGLRIGDRARAGSIPRLRRRVPARGVTDLR